MTDPGYILDLADKAARCVLGAQHWPASEDWQDAIQEAAIKAWLASQQCADAGEGYLFQVARAGVYDWLRAWLRHPRGGTILEYLNYSQPADVDAPALDVARLAPALLSVRGKHSANTNKHIAEEITYLTLLLERRSIAGIGMEMGLSRRRVYAIRERLLPRLERIAQSLSPTGAPA